MSKKNPKKQKNKESVQVFCKDEAELDAVIAKTFLDPSVLAARSIKGYYKEDDRMDINAVIDELGSQIRQINNGDMSRPEAMLLSQAHTLDSLFGEMLARFRLNVHDYPEAAEKYLKLGLKTQSQCRTTLESLSEIKNPKPYIQNNRAQYQQVNNNAEPSRARENKKHSNEVLEDKSDDEQWVDAGASQATIRDDKDMEAVGTEYGA